MNRFTTPSSASIEKRRMRIPIPPALESTSSRMNRLAKHEMHFGSFLTMNAMLEAIDKVRYEEVQGLVDDVLDEEQLALTTYGPLNRRNLPRDLLGAGAGHSRP